MKTAFDLHLHSCLSPCGSEENTPANLAGMCALAGLDAVALTDHNTTGNCAAFCAAAQALGLLALPGMELTTAEEVHVICLFPDLSAADDFGAYVYAHLPQIPNDTRIFGPQIFMDAGDGILGEEPRMLAGASDIGIYGLAALVGSYGGLAYPAHIDRPSFSLISNLGFWDDGLGFPLAELSRHAPPDFMDRPDLSHIPTITASDAHYLDQIADASQWADLKNRSPNAMLDWLRTR
ncbi:MAG: PHP domain-containing protein [Pseudoflavonifractor sp.]